MRKKLYVLGLASLLLMSCAPTVSNDKVEVTPIVSVAATENTDAGNTVSPLPAKYAEQASDNMPNGTYAVNLHSNDLKQNDDGFQVALSFYDYDRFTKEDVNSLQAGDSIQIQNQIVSVNSVEQYKDKDGNVIGMGINGGMEAGGVDLALRDEEYRTTTVDDVPLYYSIGEGTLPISKDVTIQDCNEYDSMPDGVVSNFKDLPDCITKVLPESWTQASTEITVKDGEIVKIYRRCMP